MTRIGAGEIVQFARTHGCNAKSVDLSHCDLDDVAATEELSRLVKNSKATTPASFSTARWSLPRWPRPSEQNSGLERKHAHL